MLLCILCVAAMAQQIKYSVEMNGAYADGAYAPFWHVSNRQGLGSVSLKSAYMRAKIEGRHSFADSPWALSYGVDIVGGKNHTSTFFVQQAYADVNWKMFTLSLGQKERWSNFKNKRLSTGGLTESGNARPMPQIRIEVPEYWDIFGTHGWFTLRGHLAYGWFTDDNWQKDFAAPDTEYQTSVRYHSKALYFKVGDAAKFPLTYEFGLEMVAQFGGTIHNAKNVKGQNWHNPVRFIDYLKILIPSRGDSEYSDIDRGNVAGNHLGSWHTALTWHADNWKLGAYYEHTFEDHSQMFWEYGIWTEQLVGLELSLKNFKWIKSIALEYFNLKNHSGPIYHDTNEIIPDQISCADNNYNHSWYTGWFNYGMIIGSPLATSPVYNEKHLLQSPNNRVEAFHLGIEGEPFEQLQYRLLLTKSNNWGTYFTPFLDIKENLAGLVELTYNPVWLKGWSATASFAFDDGDLYGNNNGAMLSIRKCGLFNF